LVCWSFLFSNPTCAVSDWNVDGEVYYLITSALDDRALNIAIRKNTITLYVTKRF
jgi:hypothetical protein